MKRGWARTLAPLSLLPLVVSLGCDALTVRSFAGTVGQFTLESVTASTIPAGQHLELWARTQYNDIVRVDGFTNINAFTTEYGLMIRQAISLDDPCMIDAYLPQADEKATAGHLLTSPDAYTTSHSGGVEQSPEQQAQQVTDRIHQLTDNTTIATGGPLLAIMPWSPVPPPTVPPGATPEERKTICDAYVNDPNNPNPYVPNPYQITSPLRGYVYGFANFLSQTPPSAYNGFRIDTPINLKGVQEIFFTLEGDNVDPKNRGPLFLTSTMTQGGRDVVHFELTHADPKGTATGSASLLVDLDEDPVQF
jgi:hypothetical protein